jgi:hypothetical protein
VVDTQLHGDDHSRAGGRQADKVARARNERQ